MRHTGVKYSIERSLDPPEHALADGLTVSAQRALLLHVHDALLGGAVSDVRDLLVGGDLAPRPQARLTMKPYEARMLLAK